MKLLKKIMQFLDSKFFPNSNDKFRHLMIGIIVAVLSMVTLYLFTKDSQVGLSITIVFLIGIGRELYGVKVSGAKFDGLDIIATTIGGVIGAMITNTFF